jgi:hypothetical protein
MENEADRKRWKSEAISRAWTRRVRDAAFFIHVALVFVICESPERLSSPTNLGIATLSGMLLSEKAS